MLGAREDAKFTNRMYKNWFHTSRAIQSDQEYKRGGDIQRMKKIFCRMFPWKELSLSPTSSPQGEKRSLSFLISMRVRAAARAHGGTWYSPWAEKVTVVYFRKIEMTWLCLQRAIVPLLVKAKKCLIPMDQMWALGERTGWEHKGLDAAPRGGYLYTRAEGRRRVVISCYESCHWGVFRAPTEESISQKTTRTRVRG